MASLVNCGARTPEIPAGSASLSDFSYLLYIKELTFNHFLLDGTFFDTNRYCATSHFHNYLWDGKDYHYFAEDKTEAEKCKWLAQGHTARRSWNWHLCSGCLAPKPIYCFLLNLLQNIENFKKVSIVTTRALVILPQPGGRGPAFAVSAEDRRAGD